MIIAEDPYETCPLANKTIDGIALPARMKTQQSEDANEDDVSFVSIPTIKDSASDQSKTEVFYGDRIAAKS
jgi:hypothetical protein